MTNRATILVVALILHGCVKVQDDELVPLRDASADSTDDQPTEVVEGGTDAMARNVDGADGGTSDQHSTQDSTMLAADAGFDSDVPTSCPDPCATVGELRCGHDLTHVQTCTPLGAGCSSWTDVGACKVDQICCGSSCLAVDATHCYGCTEACDGVTPVCDKSLKKCGCDDASCHALDAKVCDATMHECTVDPANPDVYVDPAGARPEEGTKDHPYKTITAALLAPRVSGILLHVHVARGRYDKDHGETFPLVVRGASIEGTSPIDTIISGSGPYDSRPRAGAISAEVSATVVIGGDAQKSGISNVTLYDSATSPMGARYGVFCDGGNGAAVTSVSTPANTTLDQLSIGPGYDIGIAAATSTVPGSMGCNLQVTASDFQVVDAGVWAIGCGNTPSVGVRIPVAVRLGDGTQKGGNRFKAYPLDSAPGIGVRISSCVTAFLASFNTFKDARGGVDIVQPKNMNERNELIFRHNTFYELWEFGIKASGGAAFIELSDNTFNAITPLTLPAFAAGLYVEGYQSEQSFAHVGGSNNQFLYNQAGVVFESALPIDPTYVEYSSLNGGNVFHCNYADSYADPFNILGGDVILRTPSRNTFEFKDDEWDHAPPTFATTLTVDGTDMIAVPGVSVDTTNAIDVDLGCQRR